MFIREFIFPFRMMNRFTQLHRVLALMALLAANNLTVQAQNVGIGTTAPDASAALDIVSSSKGALLPRLTSTQRGTIASPARGLLIFQTDAPAGFYYNVGTTTAPDWQQVATAATNGLTRTGSAFGLGGTLTGATTITQAGNAFTLTGGNVGIGTTTPIQKLEVDAGGIRASGSAAFTAVSATNQGAHLQWNRSGGDGETWLINHMGLGSANAGIRFAGITTSTGTGPTEWARFLNNGNFGIGTTAPTEKLDVVGNIQSSANIAVDYSNANAGTTNNTLRFGPTNSGEAVGSKRTTGGNQYGLDFYTASANRMSITNAGNVGIGTTTPFQKLDVSGALSSTTAGTSPLLRLSRPDNINVKYANALELSLGSYGTTNQAQSQVDFNLSNGNTDNPDMTALTLRGDGKVGIGTTTPRQPLEVAGQIFSNSGGFRFPDNTVQTTAATGATAGDNLGNHTATQTLNLGTYALTGTGADLGTTIGLGIRADGGLNIGQNNTSGNVFLGYQAGQSTTGGLNQFSGYQSGYGNTTGSFNQFSGYKSGFSNTTGNYNQFSGYQSGYGNTGGGYNLFSGYQSGFGNTTGNGNTYLGSYSGGSSDLINATAIGVSAYVGLSNTIQLGNGDITALRCKVGVTTPSDMRFKYQVQTNVPGLAFITRLRPVTYRFDQAKMAAFLKTGELPAGFTPDPAAAVQTGFLAQQVEQAAQAVGYRFDGLHAPANTRDHYSLIYAQFVVPLVQAVQEQQTQIEALQAQNVAQQTQIAILREQAVQTTADHASLLSLQAQLAQLLGDSTPATTRR